MRTSVQKKGLGRERGVALLMVLIAIAILTTVAVEFSYNSRVDLELATNQRDELQAFYLAKSGIGMSRMLLRFQKQVDAIQLPNLGALLSGLGGGAGGGLAAMLRGGATPGAAGAAPAASSLNIQLWRLAHVDCHMLQGLVPPVTEGSLLASGARPRASSRAAPTPPSSASADFDRDFPDLAAKQADMSFGTFKGCFDSKIEDEEQKLNVNQLDAPQLSAQAAATRLLALFNDKRFEFVFDHEDANHVKAAPPDVMLAMHDWADEDETQSTLNLSGTGNIFAAGFSDEAAQYDRYTPRYRPKNSRFDSVDELYMVYGVSDLFMAAFKERLTVYPDINTPLNINSDDPVMLYLAILSVADPIRPDARLRDPLFVDSIIQKIRAARMMSFMGMSVADFVNVVQLAGVPINTSIVNSREGNRFVNDKSTTFSITATGEAGRVKRSIHAVIRLDDGLGRLMYWREE